GHIAEVPRHGDSLLDVLAEYYADCYAQTEEAYNRPGHVPDEMLDEARSIVEDIDRLKHKVTSTSTPSSTSFTATPTATPLRRTSG
ncbi:hypothetical protein, partial [Streptomyces sp900116325]|uniref:hypothetical protein n=1 Tax=Streptomyces sp. 900116325 TaxID=3154295 RepID=UPI0033EFEB5C